RSYDNVTHTETVVGNYQPVSAVVTNPHVDDFGHIVTQRGFATREPKVSNLRHRARKLLNLRKRHVAGAIQLFVIETGLAERIAARGDKQNDCAETLFAFRRAQQLHELNGFVWHS